MAKRKRKPGPKKRMDRKAKSEMFGSSGQSVDYSAEETEFLKAVELARRGKITLSPQEILHLIHCLGYRRVESITPGFFSAPEELE